MELNNLNDLLFLGVVFVSGYPRLPCVGERSPDGWSWPASTWFPNAGLSTTIRELKQLHHGNYIRVTCNSTVVRPLLALRVYLVPQEMSSSHDSFHRNNPGLSLASDKRRSFLQKLPSLFAVPHEPVVVVPFYKPGIPASRSRVDDRRISIWLKHLCKDPAYKLPSDDELTDGKQRLVELYDSIKFRAQYDLADEDIASIMSGDIPGLKTQLYEYQKETVAQMLHMEENPGSSASPRLLEIQGRGNRTFYFHPEEYVVYKQIPCTYDNSRGGILAEDMGLGKTCICLALVCTTMGIQARLPERGQVETGVEMTQFLKGCQDVVPPLALLSSRRVVDIAYPWRRFANLLSPSCQNILSTYLTFFYVSDKPMTRGSSRATSARAPKPKKRIYLSTATLIVCPDSLTYQWRAEIEKHVSSDVSFVEIKSHHIPDLDNLIHKDLVLISMSQFRRVYTSTELNDMQQIRWKRLIVDEGHIVGNNNAILATCGEDWIAESRWVVSGTPTAGLTRLDSKSQFDYKQDLDKLGRILGTFLRIEPWCSDSGSWQRSVVKPFLSGRYDGFENAFRVLSRVLVRHQADEVSRATRLPPLHNNVVFLKPSFNDMVIANLMVANITLHGVVSSKPDGAPYSDKDRGELNRLIRRVQRATFYSTGFDVEDIAFMKQEISEYWNKNNESLASPERLKDVETLQRALQTYQYTEQCRSWYSLAQYSEMGYHVKGMDNGLGKAYQVVGQLQQAKEFFTLGGGQVNHLQHELVGLTAENLSANPVESLVQDSSKYWDGYRRLSEIRVKRRNKDQSTKIASLVSGKEVDTVDVTPVDISSAAEPSTPPAQMSPARVSPQTSPSTPKNTLLRDSNIVGTSSAKLSYLISKSLALVADHKIIVFYDYEDTGYFISEAYTTVGIPHLIYDTKSVSQKRRAQYLATFNTSDKFRVLLMNVKVASHGLNVTAASRVFFISPLWRRDVEAQAIKRAHRIGQKSEVHVETLILEGTLEEAIYRRRVEISEHEGVSSKNIADDQKLGETIMNFEPMPMDHLQRETSDEIAFLDSPIPAFSNSFEPLENPDEGLVVFEPDSPKMRRASLRKRQAVDTVLQQKRQKLEEK